MKIEYKPHVVKQVRKLPVSEKKKIIRKLEFLSQEPKSGKALKGDLDGFYSLRAWPYRIIYEIQKGKIIVYSIAHRQSAYK